jgi:hypothetical protein
MTEPLGYSDPFASLGRAAQRAGLWLGRAGFGLFLLLAAAAAVLATTFVGVLLAIAAVFLAFTQRRRRRLARVAARRARSHADAGTLEARRTPDGWVIEPGASWR